MLRGSQNWQGWARRAWSPRDLPRLRWWGEPSGFQFTGSSCDSWTDGNLGTHNLSNTGTNRPAKVASALNGYDGIQTVTASAQVLKKQTGPLLTSGTFSFGLIFRVDATVANQTFIAHQVPGADGFVLFSNAGNYGISYQGTGTLATASAVGLASFNMHIFTATAGQPATYRINSTGITLTPTSHVFVNPGATASLAIGGRITDLMSTATYVAGFMCDTDIGTAGIANVERYWKTKYAL